jgi:hypothetical protein
MFTFPFVTDVVFRLYQQWTIECSNTKWWIYQTRGIDMVILCSLCNVIIADVINFELQRLNLLGVQFTTLSACRSPAMTTPLFFFCTRVKFKTPKLRVSGKLSENNWQVLNEISR